MTKASDEKKLRTKGEVRIRSNVCTDPKAWHLIPGDVLNRYGMSPATQEQKDEKMYYERCSLCSRTIFEIKEDGCDDRICRGQSGNISRAEAKRRKKRYLDDAESL